LNIKRFTNSRIEVLSKKRVGIYTDGVAVNLGMKGGAVKILLDTINQHLGDQYNCENFMTVVHGSQS
jgi:hypothetical protein